MAGGVDIGAALEQQLYFAIRDGIPPPGPLRGAGERAISAGLLLAAAGASLTPRPRPAVAPGGVLLVVRQPVHVRIYRPIEAALAAANGPPTHITRVSAAASDRGSASAGPRIEAFLDRAAAGALAPTAVSAERLLRAWHGVSLRPATRRALARQAVRLRPRLAVAAASLQAAVRRARPALVATYDEVGSWGRLVAATAAATGVPSLDLPHAEAADPIGTRGATYDRIAVFGPIARERMRAAGIEDERVVEIGAPNFDALVAEAAARQPTGERRILVTSQHTAGTMTREVKERTLRAAVQAAGAAAPCVAVMRPHPTESDDLIDRICAEPAPEGVRVVADRHSSLGDLLLRSWLMITGSSQTVLEAAIVGVPSISINATGGPDPVTYASEGIALGAENAEGAAGHVRRMLDPEAAAEQVARARSALERHLGPLDGRASARAAELIIGLARGDAGHR
jgi:hypothetical protein